MYYHNPDDIGRWVVCLKFKPTPPRAGFFGLREEVKNMKNEFSPQKIVDSIMLFSSNGGINKPGLFHDVIQNLHFRGQSIQISGFIGQGGKDHLGRSDFNLLEKYSRLKEELSNIYPFGVEISLIGADTHGLANSMSDNGYLDLMRNEAMVRGYNWILLSDLYKDKGLILPTWTEVSGQLYYEKGKEYEEWTKIPVQIRNDLIKQAGKHQMSDKYFEAFESNNILSAFYYFRMRKQEEQIFVPDWQSILFVINGSRVLAEHTFPQSIAQMYWYETRHHGGKGSRELNRNIILPPPWFRND